MGYEFCDRYSATGTPRPKMLTVCHNCEGMGCYPEKIETTNGKSIDDGWIIVKCDACNGSRKCSTIESFTRFPAVVISSFRFFFRVAFNKKMHREDWSFWRRVVVTAKIAFWK